MCALSPKFPTIRPEVFTACTTSSADFDARRSRSSISKRYSVASRYAGSSSIIIVSTPAPATKDSAAVDTDCHQLSTAPRAVPAAPRWYHAAADAPTLWASCDWRNARRSGEWRRVGCAHVLRMKWSRPARRTSRNSGLKGLVVTVFSGRGWRMTPGWDDWSLARSQVKSENRRVTLDVSDAKDGRVVWTVTP